MKFKLDENFGRRTISLFKQSGHDVHTVYDENQSGSDDLAIFERCVAENRCRVTLDLDFADILQFPPSQSCGIIVVRLPRNPSLTVLESLIQRALDYLEKNPIEKNLWIVEPGCIRIHQKPDQS
jgi:predicted nuclease of predicted toxin-antitoxin system